MTRNSPQIDTGRVRQAADAILDSRDPIAERGAIMGTLEGTVSAILLMVMGGHHANAAAMLNEGLLQGVEGRLAHAANKKPA